MEIKEILKKGDPTKLFYPGSSGVYSNFNGWRQQVSSQDNILTKFVIFAPLTYAISAISKGIR